MILSTKKRKIYIRSTKKRSTKKRSHGGQYTVKTPSGSTVNVAINKKNVNYLVTTPSGKMIVPMHNIIKIEPYFNGIGLEKEGKYLFQNLLERIGFQTQYDVQKKVEEAVTSQYPFTYPCSKRTWNKCTDACATIIKKMVDAELNSTAYMLRALSKSILWADKKKGESPPITFEFKKALTGSWAEDKDNIELQFKTSNKTNRLIMGFGPSAAGKTYWAQTLINLFSVTPNFPTTFISIDGGLYRESSMIYQMTINTLARTCLAGFSNLVVTGLLSTMFEYMGLLDNLFDADIVKKAMVSFLQKYKGQISLYVPETLGSCGRTLPRSKCVSKFKPYIDLTNDTKWIGLLIWQHERGDTCDKEENYKCKGCIDSGEERQMSEGKIYSSAAYGHSMYKGWKHMTGLRTNPPVKDIKILDNSKGNNVMNSTTANSTTANSRSIENAAPGGQFMIHNTGGRKTGAEFNITTIVDYTPNKNELSATLSNTDNQMKYKYLYSKQVAK